MKPSVGRVVHYVSYGTPGGEFRQECRAAIITECSSDPGHPTRVGLAVLNPTGAYFNRGVTMDETGQRGGSWHWPERI